MTPHEFMLSVTANQENLEAEQYLTAWSSSLLLNCWAKKGSRMTPDKLLGRKKKGALTMAQAKDRGRQLSDKADVEDETERSGRRWGRA